MDYPKCSDNVCKCRFLHHVQISVGFSILQMGFSNPEPHTKNRHVSFTHLTAFPARLVALVIFIFLLHFKHESWANLEGLMPQTKAWGMSLF